jgi:hypothetical protein
MSVEYDKKKRKVIYMDKKLDIIKRFDNGQSKASISRTLGLNESLARLILSKSNEYTERGEVASTSFSTVQCTINRSSILVEMEYLLITWLEDCNQKWIPIGTNNIMVKAISLFSTLKENKFKGDTTIFSASRGSFEKFKARTRMHNDKLTGEAASANKDTAAKFPACFKKIMEKNKYDDCQIFSIYETGLYLKKMLSRTFLAKNEESQPASRLQSLQRPLNSSVGR